MTGNVTNLLVAQMLLSSRRPNSRNGRQIGPTDPGLGESESVWMQHAASLDSERPRPDFDSWRPQQAWSEEHRWPADDEFLTSPSRQQQKWEQQHRRRLYREGLERLRELLEREREERIRSGEWMIG
jgi:hypothetical protein